METSFMALALFDEARSRYHFNEDWERDLTRLEEEDRRYRTRQAFRLSITALARALFKPIGRFRRAHA